MIEPPDCRFGYTSAQVDHLTGSDKDAFRRWMFGQTMALCQGTRWDPVLQQEVADDCGPHGPVVYSYDLKRYLAGNRHIFD